MTDVLLGILSGSSGVTLLGLVGYFLNRRLRAAQVDDTDASAAEKRANAQKTSAEAWGLMQGSFSDVVQQLVEVRAQLDKLDTAHRAALRHISEVHEWESRGRPGPLPPPPADLAATG